MGAGRRGNGATTGAGAASKDLISRKCATLAMMPIETNSTPCHHTSSGACHDGSTSKAALVSSVPTTVGMNTDTMVESMPLILRVRA